MTGDAYHGHRFPREIISYCVWLYFRFGVSFRDLEELMSARGVLVSFETVRRWCEKFGETFAPCLRKRGARTDDKWHLDGVFLKINGVTHFLWRAVNQNGVVLDILVQPKHDRFAAIRFFPPAIADKWTASSRVIVTDKLRSYGVVKRVVMPRVAHRQHRYLNNRAETRINQRESARDACGRFKSARHAQRFLEVHGIIGSHFFPRRHLPTAPDYRQLRSKRFRIWKEVTGATALA